MDDLGALVRDLVARQGGILEAESWERNLEQDYQRRNPGGLLGDFWNANVVRIIPDWLQLH